MMLCAQVSAKTADFATHYSKSSRDKQGNDEKEKLIYIGKMFSSSLHLTTCGNLS